MKRNIILILAMLPFVFSSCSDNEEPPPPPPMVEQETTEERLVKEYNINKPNLILEAYWVISDDTKYILLNGRIDNKLWIGYYDRQTKQPLFDWTDSNVLETIVTLDRGYGEGNITHKINLFIVSELCSNGGIFSFTLFGYDDTYSSYEPVTGYLYFIKEGQLINSYKESRYSLRGQYVDVEPWFEGFMVCSAMNVFGGDRYYSCFDAQGNKLFEVANNNNWHSSTWSPSMIPVNYEEAIFFWSENTIKRVNIKNGIEVWSNWYTAGELFTVPEGAKSGGLVIEKLTENTWKYSREYTQHDGTKGSVSMLLNIDTGTIDTGTYEKSE